MVTPISLSTFTAKANSKKQVAVQWQTANEINTNHFNIQRSTDNRNFVTVGKVEAKGTGSNYLFNDDINGISAKLLCYRLESVDADNLKQYSRVVTIKFGELITTEIFPNPASSYITLSRSLGNTEIIVISDIIGNTVMSQQVSGYKTPINIAGLAKGMYVIHTQHGNNLIFIKE